MAIALFVRSLEAETGTAPVSITLSKRAFTLLAGENAALRGDMNPFRELPELEASGQHWKAKFMGVEVLGRDE